VNRLVSGRYHVVTLGCKLNQFDTAAIEGMLRGRGLERAEDPGGADVLVVNTCTVTSRADADARRLVRRLRRASPAARLLVTGCYAERRPADLAALSGVDAVVGNSGRARLPSLLDRWAGPRADAVDHGCETRPLPEALHFGRTRAYLKVQEGCDLRCSYCIIPTVRGASRSVPPGEVEGGLRRLVERGFREVVLTGVNTGDWGKDLDPPLVLADLLERLMGVPGLGRLRLNSLEPRTVTDRMVQLMSGAGGRIARHLQVPLQSGSDAILRGMRRNYRTALYADVVERLRQAMPDIGIGADVIVGFPGEDESRFEETRGFIRDVGLSYLHVFSWSAREGTDAFRLAGRVPRTTVRRRVALLRAQAAEQGLAFRRSFTGRTLEAVTLEALNPGGGRRALTGNFIEVSLPHDAPGNRLLPVRITGVEDAVTMAELAETA
jgi:threonylcarbamoyladenosine tRNA methylthiotransferase MtaB